MKRKLTLILSFALCLCMLVGMLPFAAVADDPVAKDYDTAADGEVLYTVDFSGEDGVYDTSYTLLDAESDVNVQITGQNSNILTFTGKTAAKADFYGGNLRNYHITGCVYTISYYVEQPLNVRGGVQFYHDGTYRIGIVNVSNNTQNMTIIENGSTGENLGNIFGTVSRKVDAENNNRQYFKAVIDGVNMVAKYYALSTNDTYQEIGFTHINPAMKYNYLRIGMYNWDAMNANSLSLGNVAIAKGDEFATNGKTAYQTLYDNTAYGGTLVDINFADNNTSGITWGDFRAVDTAGSGTKGTATVTDAGSTVTLNVTSNSAICKAAYMPNAAEMATYGNFTYEFYVQSSSSSGGNTRAYAQLFGAKDNANYRCIGFCYFNTSAANIFVVSGSPLAYNGANLSNAKIIRSTATTYQTKQTPDTTDSSKPNAKVEVNVCANTLTNYILISGEWVKTGMITYNANSFVPIVNFQLFDAGTTAIFKNAKIVKGLTVSCESEADEPKYVDFKLDGQFTSTGAAQLSTAATLPTPSTANKAYYVNNNCLVDGSGNVITDKNALSLSAGYNLVELYSKYTPEFELRGYQSSLSPAANSTSIRLVGTIDTLTYESLGFKITAKWKDAEGVTHTGANTVDKNATAVYTSILAGSADGCAAVTAESLGSEYIVAIAINGVPTGENVQVDFTVTPYLVDNGEPFEYPAQIISFVNGVYSSNATPLA